MALNIDVTYSGHEQIDLLVPMFEAMTTVDEGHVKLHDDVNYKKALRRMKITGNLLQDEDANWVEGGDVDIDEVVLFPSIREINLSLDKNNFREEWSSARMGKGQMNKKIAAEIRAAVTKNILGIVGESLHQLMWVGDVTGNGDAIDGFLTILVNAVGNPEAPIAPLWAAIDSDNVIEVLSDLVLDAMPAKYRNFASTRVFVSSDVYGAWSVATGAQSNMRDSIDKTPEKVHGYTMVVLDSLPASTVIIADKDNLNYGTDIFSDRSLIVIKDMSGVDLTDFLRFKQKVAIDVKIGWINEVLLYTEIV